MRTEQAISLILWGLMFTCASLLFGIVIPRYRTDVFRERMFATRAALFDYAMDGHIAFDHPAYILLRRYLNAHIHYADRITFYRMWLRRLGDEFVNRAEPIPEPTWRDEWSLALDTLPESGQRNVLESIHHQAQLAVMKHVVRGSWVLLSGTAAWFFLYATRIVAARYSTAFIGPLLRQVAGRGANSIQNLWKEVFSPAWRQASDYVLTSVRLGPEKREDLTLCSEL